MRSSSFKPIPAATWIYFIAEVRSEGFQNVRRLEVNRSCLVFPLSAIPESNFVVCPVLLVFHDLRFSSKILYFKQDLKELDDLGQLREIVVQVPSELTKSSARLVSLFIDLLTQIGSYRWGVEKGSVSLSHRTRVLAAEACMSNAHLCSDSFSSK